MEGDVLALVRIFGNSNKKGFKTMSFAKYPAIIRNTMQEPENPDVLEKFKSIVDPCGCRRITLYGYVRYSLESTKRCKRPMALSK